MALSTYVVARAEVITYNLHSTYQQMPILSCDPR